MVYIGLDNLLDNFAERIRSNKVALCEIDIESQWLINNALQKDYTLLKSKDQGQFIADYFVLWPLLYPVHGLCHILHLKRSRNTLKTMTQILLGPIKYIFLEMKIYFNHGNGTSHWALS